MATVNISAAQGISSTKTVLAGRILSGLAISFLVLDSVMKIVKAPPVLEASTRLGIPPELTVGIGLLLFLCTILYSLPQTAVLGAILLTGYLGGAVFTNLRAAQPLFNIVFPVLFGALAWLGLLLRYPALRKWLPFTTI